VTRPLVVAVPDAPRRGCPLIRVTKARGRDDLISPQPQRQRDGGDYFRGRSIDVVEWVEALDEYASRARSPWWRRLEAAVTAVEAGERDVVLVRKVSRARGTAGTWGVAVDRIQLAGGTLRLATEELDTTTSTGRLGRGMLARLSAWESEAKGQQCSGRTSEGGVRSSAVASRRVRSAAAQASGVGPVED
jgi:site-specific DNA recombinase